MANAFGEDHDRWAEDYQIGLALKKALESKEAADILDQLAEITPATEKVPKEPISQYFDDKLSRLSQRIEGLQHEVETRHDLKRRFLEQIDYQISLAALSLKEFQFWGIGYNRGVDMKRNMLERQLADFRNKRRQEELRFWDDAVALRKQLRDALSQYDDILRRARLVEDTR